MPFPLRAPAAFLALLTALTIQSGGIEDRVAQALSASRLKDAQVGCLVYSTRRKAPVCSRDANKPLRLASNTKLFTTAAALALLGPEWRFRTVLAAEEATGDLHVYGSGDPLISGRRHGGDPLALFRDAARRLKEAGLDRFRGRLVLHDGLLERVLPPGFEQQPQIEWWACEMSALSFNDNCVDVEVTAGDVGEPPRVKMTPETSYVTLVNEAKTARDGGTWGFSRVDGSNRIVLRGKVPAGTRAFAKPVAIHDPARYFGTVLKETLEREGIPIEGDVVRSDAPRAEGPARELLLAEHTLAEAVASTNRTSQNLHAELILRVLGAKVRGEGTTAKGIEAVLDFLKRDVGVADVELVNGSGLSRENRASAASVVAVLEHMRAHRHAKAFLESLAVAGEEPGTLRDRMESVKGRVRAKTGTISGVSALSGYAEAASGETFVFSVLVNGWRDGSPKTFEDRLGTLLAEWKEP